VKRQATRISISSVADQLTKLGDSLRRKAPASRSGSKTNDIKQDWSAAQLQGIGAVSIAWNEVEFMLDQVLYSGLVLAGSCWSDVLTRLSAEAKLELITSAEETHRVPTNIRALIHTSVGNTRELKELRNSVVHARIFDAPNGIGLNIRRGGKIWEVLLDEPALDCLYNRLVVNRGELRSIAAIFDLFRNGSMAVDQGIMTWDSLVNGNDFTEWIDQLKSHQRIQVRLAEATFSFKH
jgi:hypothetical protein